MFGYLSHWPSSVLIGFSLKMKSNSAEYFPDLRDLHSNHRVFHSGVFPFVPSKIWYGLLPGKWQPFKAFRSHIALGAICLFFTFYFPGPTNSEYRADSGNKKKLCTGNYIFNFALFLTGSRDIILRQWSLTRFRVFWLLKTRKIILFLSVAAFTVLGYLSYSKQSPQ